MYLVCTYNTINNMAEWRPPSQPDIGGIGGLEGEVRPKVNVINKKSSHK